ncbi:MAG: hypothetical protein RR382_00315 [Tannerellaceae bacterium]
MSDEGMRQARVLSHTCAQNRCAGDLHAALDSLLGKQAEVREYLVLTFTDADVLWWSEQAQERVATTYTKGGVKHTVYSIPSEYRTKRLPVANEYGTLEERAVLTDGSAPGTSAKAVTLSGEFVLKVSKRVHAHSILLEGKLLLEGVHFTASFGRISFTWNPADRFAGNKVTIRTYTYLSDNLLNYTLQLNEVTEPVQAVLDYVRKSQSIKTFALAVATASGLCTVRENCVVQRIVPCQRGCIYMTDIGKLYALYEHIKLPVGTRLEKGTWIGEMLNVRSMEFNGGYGKLSLDTVLPVPGLWSDDVVIETTHGGEYRPAFFASDQRTLNKWWEWIALGERVTGKKVHLTVDQQSVLVVRDEALLGIDPFDVRNPRKNGVLGMGVRSVTTINANNLLYYVYGRRAIIVHMDRDKMTNAMYIRTKEFIDRNKPAGSVILYKIK